MEVFNLCDYFGFLFISYCVSQNENIAKQKRGVNTFDVVHEWNYINFTWPTPDDYRKAIVTKRYIPENNAMTGIKFYKQDMYIALPKLRPGTPVTLAVVENTRSLTTNALLKPFPSWKMNQENNCLALQSVQSMEIDRRGIMWVLDGNRITNLTRCAPKLVLLDLKSNGKPIHSFEFPEELCSRRGGFLNDLVIDENDGGYAYITENSDHDPGIIIYSRFQNRAWKIRDRSMFAEISASDFSVDGLKNNKLVSVDGIAMTPIPRQKNQERLVYYCALSGKNLFAISNNILKNEAFCRTDAWRKHIRYIGRKQGQSDGLMVDNEGSLYYGLLNLYGIGKWNIYESFFSSKIIDLNRELIIWPDSFGFDSYGYLYVLANGINKYITPTYPLAIDDQIKFRVLQLFTGTKSYLYN